MVGGLLHEVRRHDRDSTDELLIPRDRVDTDRATPTVRDCDHEDLVGLADASVSLSLRRSNDDARTIAECAVVERPPAVQCPYDRGVKSEVACLEQRHDREAYDVRPTAPSPADSRP